MKFLVKRIGNEKLMMPVGEPPERAGQKPDLKNLEKLAEMKKPLLERFEMATPLERTEAQEEASAIMRPSKNL